MAAVIAEWLPYNRSNLFSSLSFVFLRLSFVILRVNQTFSVSGLNVA